MKKLLFSLLLISNVTLAQWSGQMTNPQYPTGQMHTDLFSKAAVPAGISVVTIGFPAYYGYTNTNHFHSLSNSKQDAAIVGIISGSLVSGALFGIGKNYVKNHKREIKRTWKKIWR